MFGRNTLNKTIEYEFSNFQKLSILDIQGYNKANSIKNSLDVFLHHNAFLHLQNLKYLNIEHVFLSPNPNSTKEEPITDAYYFMYDQLESSKYEIEDHLTNVTFLLPNESTKITYNEYKSQNNFVSTFSHLLNLRFLRLYHCHLDTITWKMFRELLNLQVLSLEGNDIIEIPKLVFYFTPNLTTLILSDNNLQIIHMESFAGLFHLQNLDLSNNNLYHLSDVTFAPLPKLQYLNLENNPLTTIYSNTFEVMNMSKYLFIGSNVLLTIHKNAFNGMNYLEELIIKGLIVETLNNSLLTGMPKLKYIKLEGKINYINYDAFINSLELETIILKNCSLKFVSVDSFYGLSNLKRLDLSNNQLETLPPQIFDDLNSLKELILTGNKFTALINVLSKLQHLKMIRLDENPWNCTCDLMQWNFLNINKIKEIKMNKLSCNYKYDKRPCTSTSTELFVYNTKILPRCSTPEKYKKYNVLHVINNELKCEKMNNEHFYEKNRAFYKFN